MKRWIFFLLLYVLTEVTPITAQENVRAGIFGDSVEVTLVNLDVYVTDGRGIPVGGLTRDDFQLMVDGRPAEISHFEAVKGGAPTFFIVYVDHGDVHYLKRTKVLQYVQSFLASRLSKGDHATVINFTGQPDQRVFRFTQSSSLLQLALDGIQSKPWAAAELNLISGNSPHHKNFRPPPATDKQFENSDLNPQLPEAPGPPSHSPRFSGVGDSENFSQTLDPFVGVDFLASGDVFRRKVPPNILELARLLRGLYTLPGRKVIIYLTDGFEMRSTYEVHSSTVPADQSYTAVRRSPEFQVLPNAARYAMLKDIVEQAILAQAIILPVYVRASPTRKATSLGDVLDLVMHERSLQVGTIAERPYLEPLNILADLTGGILSDSGKRVQLRLEQFGESLDSYYSIAFSPPVTIPVGSSSRVKIKTHSSRLRLRYRRQVQVPPLSLRVAQRTMNALLHWRGENHLEIRLELGEVKSFDRQFDLVPLRVRIPIGGISLIPVEEMYVGQLSLYVAIRDDQGRIQPVRSMGVPLEIPAKSVAIAREKVYVYEIRVLIPRREHEVAICVRDEIEGEESFVMSRLLFDALSSRAVLEEGRKR